MKLFSLVLFFCILPLVQADEVPFPQPSPSAIPKAFLQRNEKAMMEGKVNSQYIQLKKFLNDGAIEAWANPKGLTTQEFFDSFGTGAVKMHQLFKLFGGCMNQAIPNSVNTAEPQTVTDNNNGTVTVTPSPSPSP